MVKVKYRNPSENMIEIGAPNLSINRPSVGSEERVGEFYYISIEKLTPFKNQARKSFNEESLKKLSDTIKQHGIKQPLTIIKNRDKEGFYEVVSGERRLRAAKIANLKKVPCIIIKSEKDAEEISLIENIQREDLNPIELGNAYKKLIELGFCKSMAEVANKVGVNKSLVVELIGYASFPKSIKELIIEKDRFSRDFLRSLKGKKTESEMLSAFNKSKEKVITKNILRIREKENKLYLSKSHLRELSKENKIEIKQFLKETINEL